CRGRSDCRHARGYNEIMMREIERRFGTNVWQQTTADAQRLYEGKVQATRIMVMEVEMRNGNSPTRHSPHSRSIPTSGWRRWCRTNITRIPSATSRLLD